MMAPELSREVHRQAARLMRGVFAGAAALFILFMLYPDYLAASDPGPPPATQNYFFSSDAGGAPLTVAVEVEALPLAFTQRQASDMATECAVVGAAFILWFYSAALMLFAGSTLVPSVIRIFRASDAEPLLRSGGHPLR